jgi:hypothetical protein
VVRAEFGRAGHILPADPWSCFVNRAGASGSFPREEGASLEQVAVVLRYKTIAGPYAVFFFQDMENIGSPFASPALSVLFGDISDQIRETTLAATHAREVCWMVHDSAFSSLCPSQWVNPMPVRPRQPLIKYAFSKNNSNKEKMQFRFFYLPAMMGSSLRREEANK